MNKNSINRYPLFPLVTLSLVVSSLPFGGIFGVATEPGAEIHFVIRDHGPALRGGGRRDNDDN